MLTWAFGGRGQRVVAAASCLAISLLVAGCGKERPQPELTGFGATRAAWDAHHEAAPSGVDGSRYLPMVGDKARYDFVFWELDPRAVDYGLHFAPGTTFEQAQTQLLAEFPPGATVDRVDGESPRCLVLRIRSAPVERAIPTGIPMAVLFGPEGVDPKVSRADIRFALLGTTLDAAGEDLGGCP
ncbi:hypothetical protein [Pedococcus dokdonensis]|uniref:hypothetical protein n=1 Tax=Pedococcus dokdonensis TaxID=443156 RepID=UPI0012FD8550|nr:hypothetical protein [Pedococcus dokdonensis]